MAKGPAIAANPAIAASGVVAMESLTKRTPNAAWTNSKR